MINFAAVVFDGFETLDLFGPVEVFGRLEEDFAINLYSEHGGIITSSQKVQVMTEPMNKIGDLPYILFIPGGIGTRDLVRDERFIDRLKTLAEDAEFILTVCTGSILFSKTGILNGKKATSNKRVFNWGPAESPGVNWIKKARWIRDGNIYTSSGVSAGIDMSLGFISDIIGHETAEKISTGIEYCWNDDSGADPFAEIYP